MDQTTDTTTPALLCSDAGYDPIEDRLRQNIRATIEALFEEELAAVIGRCRYDRGGGLKKGYRHGHRDRQLVGTFGTETVSVPRARIENEEGKITEWRSRALPRYQRLTKKAEALIASVYLAGTNTRRVKRALFGLFQGAVGKDVVSRAWRKVKVDWDAWCARSLADEDIVRLILDGTVIKTRLDRKATNISVLAAIGVRRDGQKVLLAIKNMGGESKAAWGGFLGRVPRRSRCAWPEATGLRHCRWRSRAGSRPHCALGRRAADPAVHGAQAPQPSRPCPEAHARRADRGLPRHDLRRHRRRYRNPAQGVPAQMAPEMPCGRRQPGGGRG